MANRVGSVPKIPRPIFICLLLTILFVGFNNWSGLNMSTMVAHMRIMEYQREQEPAVLPANISDQRLEAASSNNTIRNQLSGLEEQQENKAINPHPFNYMHNPKHVCQDKVFLLVYVYSAPHNLKRRMLIRKTWGSHLNYNDTVRVVFVMGNSTGQKFNNEAVSYEYDLYGDIIQEDFIDSYRNLTYKAVAGLKWVSTYCKDATWVLKTDDDVFVNIFALIRQLHNSERQQLPSTRLIMCHHLLRGRRVFSYGKWKVTKEEYRFRRYPTFCKGTAYILSADVVPLLHRLSYDVPFFWIEDVYITGMLPKKGGNITITHLSSAYVAKEYLSRAFNGRKWSLHIFAHVHDVPLGVILRVWEDLEKFVSGRMATSSLQK